MDPTLPISRRSPSLAAFLSFLWPGLGQAYVGDGPRALAFAAPPLLVLLALGVLVVVVGPVVFIAHLLVPLYAVAAGVLIALFALYWIVGIIDAAWPPTPAARVAIVVLAMVVALGAGWAGSVVFSLYNAGTQIAEPIDPPPPPGPGQTPGSPSPTPAGPPSPSPTPYVDLDGRLTVLLLGTDASRTNAEGLTDSIQLVSYDPRTDQLVMISIPRDTGQLPLYYGGTWNRKINAFMSYAQRNPALFPEGGVRALMNQVGYIVGIEVDYYATVDFTGFVQMVDLVGGVDVVLDRPIADPTYGFAPGRVGFYMQPGEHHLDGETALAYVRSRHGPRNSDFQRARRQQQVLIALRDKVDDPLILARLPSLIDAASQSIRTNAPLDRVPQLVQLLQRTRDASTQTYVLQPPRYASVVPQTQTGGLYMIRLRMDAVAELSRELFGDDSRYTTANP